MPIHQLMLELKLEGLLMVEPPPELLEPELRPLLEQEPLSIERLGLELPAHLQLEPLPVLRHQQPKAFDLFKGAILGSVLEYRQQHPALK